MREGEGKEREGQLKQTFFRANNLPFLSGQKATLFLKKQIPSPCLLVFQSQPLLLTKTSELHLINSSTFSPLLFSQIPVVLIWI